MGFVVKSDVQTAKGDVNPQIGCYLFSLPVGEWLGSGIGLWEVIGFKMISETRYSDLTI